MAPTGVGIIGLSTGTSLAAGTWGAAAHLPAIRALKDYEIVAVANSTVESAQRSIDFHGLSGAKAYGDPADIAQDPRVELVVVSVAVGKHFMLAKPALENKKSVLVEWPLGASIAESEELVKLATANGVETIVGVQARVDPLIVKVKELVASGKIGRILSTSVMINSSEMPTDRWFPGADYILDIKSGGNEFHIFFGHFLDSFVHVLGGFADLTALLKSYITDVTVVDSNGEVTQTIRKTAPDHMFIQGTLESGAIASIAHRKSKSAVDNTGVRWVITGTEGELEVTSPEASWQMSPPGRALRMKLGRGEVQHIDYLTKGDVIEATVPSVAANMARLYDNFAKGDKKNYATFESALETHRLLDRILRSAGWDSV
ncbi:hypothetical protein DL768_005259 [Monosporascus sp. mg162]|nr:hypothetical protein DL768_005259 [Monosporascus sp. mg162]